MRVFIASPLHSYTSGRSEVEGTGATVAEVLADLDRRFPGIRRRIVDEQDRVRQHMRIYVGTEPAAALDQPIPEGQEIHILQALSGGAAYSLSVPSATARSGPPPEHRTRYPVSVSARRSRPGPARSRSPRER